MKYFRNTILLLLLLALLPACSNEEEVPGNPGELRLTLSVPGAKLTRSTTPLSGESTLSGICLLFYPQGAAGTEEPAFFYRNAGVSQDNGSWNNIFKARDLSGLTDGAAYDVYALASLPDATEVPGWKTAKDDFLALREKQFNRTDAAAPGISFSGKATYTHNSSAATKLEINLVRTVARLDITLANAPDGVQGSVTGALLYTYYQQGKGAPSTERTSSPLMKTDAATPDAGTPDAGATPNTTTYRAYIYENPAAATKPVSIEFTVGGLTYTAEVQPAGSNEIKRNHINSVSLTVEDD